MNNPLKQNSGTIAKPEVETDLTTGAESTDANRSLTELRGNTSINFNAPRQPLNAMLAKLINSQAIVVAVVLVVSIGSLMFMRSTGMGAKTTIKAVKLDYEPPSAAQAAEQARILAELERSLAPLNVTASTVQKNPFTMKEDAKPVDAAAPQDDSGRNAREREAMIKNALAQVTLNGVMDGPVPLARVNGRTVRVGDTVAEVFIVGEIHDRAIDLLVDNMTFTVSMGDGSPTQKGLRANPQQNRPRR